jgi:hypothetical protein
LASEYTEEIDDRSWARQPEGVQRYVTLSVHQRMTEELTKVGDCSDAKKRDNFRRSVVATARWFAKPSRVQESPYRPRVNGFYKQRGAQPLETFLLEFHPKKKPFFSWLSDRKFDRGRFWTVMEGLVTARNSIAHGDSQLSLTLDEVRTYAATCVILVRQIRKYVAE